MAVKTILSDRPPLATLVIEGGDQLGLKYSLTGRPVVIGRGEDVDFILSDPQCSRHHARIRYGFGKYVIDDLKSSNGTYVNEQEISDPQPLNSGDRIEIGHTILVLELTEIEVDESYETMLIQEGIVPSRFVLTNATEINERLGHENLGFLSESHGFMPRIRPFLQSPSGYQAWDEMVERMPELYRSLSLRQTFDDMPIFSASEANLPDEFLLRASALMSIFAYAYYRVEPNPPVKLPDCIIRPWEEITRRLERPSPVLSYIDLIIYNWKLLNPMLENPIQVENMNLLIPTVDNAVERNFYLGQVEILAGCTPIIGAVVRAQEAVHHDDAEALAKELIIITDALHHVTYESLMKISLNPYSGPYYVDPVVWAKTVGPLAVPIEEGVPGPSGIASPIFHLLDEFLGRQSYSTRLGEEMTLIQNWFPKHWQDFLKAVAQISVSEYVKNHPSGILQGIFQEATQAYVAETGFLGRHRLKAYGFLETAFKVGRSVTIGSFSGKFKDRAWDEVHTQLNNSRLERNSSYPQFFHHANVKKVNTLSAEGSNWVKQIVLDVSGTGVRYQPGDRCAVLPENNDALVEKMLKALHARGNEPVQLNTIWRESISLREGYEESTTLPLRTLLTFGKIRPVDRSIAKDLYIISRNEKLKRIIEARAEDQWELWDILGLLIDAGFETKRLWKAHLGEQENICRIVPPESFRMYSVSSIMQDDYIDGASELHLTIGRLVYETEETELSNQAERLGTASNYLGDTSLLSPEDIGRVSFRLVHPPRFSLPKDPNIPIVMFAGGTGLSTFRSFILERTRQVQSGASWLFFGTRTRADIYYQDELEHSVVHGNLNVRIAFSRDEIYLKNTPPRTSQQFEIVPGSRQYIGDEMLKEENARILWDLLRSKSKGGKEAYFYICGRTDFANAVIDAIKTIIDRYSDDGADKERTVQDMLYRLVGENRYMQEIFTTYAGSHIQQGDIYDASDVALHNDDEHGYWMIISGRVYDLTEFAHLHPGGFKIIREYTGMDATQAYRKILHHANPEVDSMLGMYEIGIVRRLNFGMEWGVFISSTGLQSITLAATYRTWIRFLYFVVELENALHNEFSIQEEPIIRNETPDSKSMYKTQLILEIHKRFILEYVDAVTGESLDMLWAVTSGLCSQNKNVRWMENTINAIRQSEEAQTVEHLSNDLAGEITVIQQNTDRDDMSTETIDVYFDLLESGGKQFMRDMRLALRTGIQIFEEFESGTLNHGKQQLLAVLEEIPTVLETYYSRIFSGMRDLEND